MLCNGADNGIFKLSLQLLNRPLQIKSDFPYLFFYEVGHNFDRRSFPVNSGNIVS